MERVFFWLKKEISFTEVVYFSGTPWYKELQMHAAQIIIIFITYVYVIYITYVSI